MNFIRDFCMIAILFGLAANYFLTDQKLSLISQDVKATQSILLMHIDKVEAHKSYNLNEAIKDIFSKE